MFSKGFLYFLTFDQFFPSYDRVRGHPIMARTLERFWALSLEESPMNESSSHF